MPLEPTVFALELLDRPPFKNGDQLLAVFCARFVGMEVRGLHLVRTEEGGFRIVSPAVDREDHRQAIRFVDPSSQHELMDAARKVYQLMGGKNGAYRGQIADR